MARSYNHIYSKLVRGSDDIVGHVAYALYKANKIKYIEEFKNRNKKEPTESDLEAFHQTSCLPGSLEGYRHTAIAVLGGFMQISLEESTKQIEEDCINSHQQMFTNAVEPLKPMRKGVQFFFGVSQSIVGAFGFAILLALFGFINLFKASDLNISIRQDKPQQTTIQQDSIPSDTISSQKK